MAELPEEAPGEVVAAIPRRRGRPTRRAAAGRGNAEKVTAWRWRKLAQAARGRRVSELEEIRWAKDRYFVLLKDIDPEEVPSCGALFFLEMAKKDPKGFLERLAVKLLPTRSLIETGGGEGDTPIAEAIAHLERLAERLEAGQGKGES